MGIIAGALLAGGMIDEFRLDLWSSSRRTPPSPSGDERRVAHHPHDGPENHTAGAGRRLRCRDRRRISLFTATALGVPVSTTHTITGAIIGVGSTRRMSAVRWGIAGASSGPGFSPFRRRAMRR